MDEVGFSHFAELDPQSIAIVDLHGVSWSRGKLFALINRLARALRSVGLSGGDVVAIAAPNCMEYLAVYLSAIQAGLYIVPINWHLAPEEIAFVLSDSGAKAIVAHERLGPMRLAAIAAGKPQVLISIGNATGFTPLAEFIAGQSSAPLSRPAIGRVMSYTSATTGRPKAIIVPLQDSNIEMEKVARFHSVLGIEPGNDHVHLCASTLYHAAPLRSALMALHMGHRLILADRWDGELLLQLIETHRVTTSFMVPAMFIRLAKLPESLRSRYSTTSLRLVTHSAAPCPADIKKEMIAWWGPLICEIYGAAEGQGTFATSREWLAFPGTVGRPIPGSRIRILDDNGHELPTGQVGTIYMTRYTGDSFAYKGNPEATRKCHVGEFFTVGDVGYVNAEGYLFLVDRKVDVIISSGMNIYSAEIEQVLITHREVADCAVIGIPHELFGEVPKAIVQPASGASPGPRLRAEILRYLSGRLAAMKLPKQIEFVGKLPRDASGKLRKRLLRDQARQNAFN